MLFDIHGDIWTDVTVKRQMGLKNIIRDYHLERFKKGNMVGGVFVIWIDPPHDERPKERLIESIKAMNTEIWENQDILKIIYNRNDFYQAIEENKLAVLLGLEGLSGIGEDVETIYTLYQLGFRHATLTWNEQNALATGVKGDVNRGLTNLGRDAVKIMESLGMILDVSHANDKTFWDIYNIATKPFIASHSNSRALCNVPRNLTDEQIKAIGEKGGLVGINAFNEFINLEHDKRTIDYLINHIEHIVNLIGIDHVALGFDFFEYIGNDTADTFTEDPYVGTLGIEDISKGNNLILKLQEKGFSKEDIEKIGYKNFLNLI
ncbi:dipeptidase [Tissierella sp.]|uniref:dipeptidase n=1 Tax=Tissierella sp. TaxID=41274 RepID=UPI0028ADA169|nr:dipeptidase [Tissierella sp.]